MASSDNKFFTSSLKSTSAPITDLQEPFSELVMGASSPLASPFSGKLFTGGVPSSVISDSGCTFGPSFVAVSRVELLCGGYIGSGARFCCKNKSDCQVQSHGRKKYNDIKPGIYLKSQGEDAFTSPFTPASSLGANALDFLLKLSLSSPQAARVKLDLINQHDGVIQTSEDLQQLFNSNPDAGMFTPRKRKCERLDLKVKLDSALGVVDEEEPGEEAPGQNFATYMKDLTKTVEESHADLTSVWDDVHEIKSQVGIPSSSCAPSLWAAHLENKSDIEDLNKTIAKKADVSMVSQIPTLESYLSTLERKVLSLENDVSKAFDNVKREFSILNSSSQLSSGFPNVGATLTPDPNLIKRLETIEKLMTALANGDLKNQASVRVGRFHFQSMEEVGAWADKHLPPHYPFGPFIDIYSFLERVKSSRDIGDILNAVSDMDTRKKANLSADEATIVEAFQHPLPRCFRGSSSSSGSSIGSWLPGIKNKVAWENKSGTQGVKIAIEDNLEGIRSRIDGIIEQRLGRDYSTGKSYDEAAGLAREMLSETVTFLKSLNSFITTTYKNLIDAGYPDDAAWGLVVTKLVYRFFATDCYHDKRGIATELFDSVNHRAMCIGSLWATFSTHQVMRDYLRLSFENHPSISAEYTRFLVAHAGVSKVEKAMKGVDALTTLVASLEKKIETAEKKATTASSKADEAVKLAKKAKRDE